MAVFATLLSTSLWSLVVSQDDSCVAEQCGFNAGPKDVNSMVQLNLGQASSLTVVDKTEPFVAGVGESCATACGSVACDLAKIQAANTPTGFNAAQGANCVDLFGALNDPGAPSTVVGSGCLLNSANPSTTTCEAPPPDTGAPDQRLCACFPDGGENGDPHIQSLRGAHYTLLQQGIFVAWNFSKAVPAPAVPGAAPATRGWQLLAAYGGDRFVTQGLVLVDRHSEQSMEITAEDCSWRVKEKKSPWRKAEVEVLSAEDGTTSIQVKKLHEKFGGTKMLRSVIMLQMESGSGMNNIGELAVHCRPGNRLDFKMTMFQKSDIDHVGGELGVAPDATHSYHFLFSKKNMVQMRSDQEFKATGSWMTLGGSPYGAKYVEEKHQAASLVQWQGCSDAQEEDARAICSKHLQETMHPEIFSDCVFDMCRGGDESFAEGVAEFLMPLEKSNS